MGQVDSAPSGTGRIHLLPPGLANAIAAGEVVDRPASVVKELVENAIDARSRRIEVELRGGGQEYIRVSDDGKGIAPDQVSIAFQRHATSKVSRMEHLEAVRTLGFRGEALPSIAAVARIELRSRPEKAPEALRLRVDGGTLAAPEPVGAPVGTSVAVRDLFFNTPARLKFLKTTATERRYVIQTVGRLAMAHPGIAFRLVAEGREVLATAGQGDLLAAALAVWGKGLAGALLPVGTVPSVSPATGPYNARNAPPNGAYVWGFAGKPNVAKSQRTSQAFIVNGRWIESGRVRAALEKAYHGLLPSRHFPVAVLHLAVDPAAVDVNVHPNKTEVRFRNENGIFRAVYHAVRQALLAADLVPRWDGERERRSAEGGAVTVEPPADRVREGSDGPPYRVANVAADADTALRTGEGASGTAAGAAGGVREVFPALWDWPERASDRRGPRASRPVSEQALDTRTTETGVQEGDPAAVRELEVLGQMRNTYIVAQGPDGITILDQHVVHERILYESGVARLQHPGEGAKSDGAGSEPFAHQLGLGRAQPLLVPTHLELAPEVVAAINGHLSLLERLGLGCEPFGSDGILVRTVPLPVRGEHVRHRMLRKMVEEIAHVLERTEPEQESAGSPMMGLEELPPYLDRIVASMACRSSVMAGDRLELEEMQALIAALAGVHNPFRCPHGRPILIRMPLEDLERRFGR